jgi:hypothetical protein
MLSIPGDTLATEPSVEFGTLAAGRFSAGHNRGIVSNPKKERQESGEGGCVERFSSMRTTPPAPDSYQTDARNSESPVIFAEFLAGG